MNIKQSMIHTINNRKSIRNYKADDVDSVLIDEILSCADKAPSSKGIKNWDFMVLRNSNKDKIAELALDNLQLNHRKESTTCSIKRSCEIIKEAPVLILVFNKSPYIGGESNLMKTPNEDMLLGWNVEIQSVSAAIQNILLSSCYFGLGSLWIADIMFVRKEICNYVNSKYDLVAGVVIGYSK